MGTGGSFVRSKAKGNSLATGVEIKNVWSSTSITLISLCGVVLKKYRDNSTAYTVLIYFYISGNFQDLVASLTKLIGLFEILWLAWTSPRENVEETFPVEESNFGNPREIISCLHNDSMATEITYHDIRRLYKLERRRCLF
jgi:hypothetical protein